MKTPPFVSIFVLLLALGAGSGLAQILPGGAPETEPKPAEPEQEDVYRRHNPRSSFLSFLSAAQSGNNPLAAQYMELKPNLPAHQKESLVRQLHYLLDRGYLGELDLISRDPSGRIDDGLPPEIEKAGSIVTQNRTVDLLLVHTERDGLPVWLISAQTLAQIPQLYQDAGFRDIASYFPPWLSGTFIFGMPIWAIAATLLLLPVAWWLAAVLIAVFVRIVRRFRPVPPPPADAKRGRHRPEIFLLTVVLHYFALSYLGTPLLYRHYYGQFITVLLLFGVGWLLFQIIDTGWERLRRWSGIEMTGTAQSVLLLAKRMVKAMVAIVIGLIALRRFGLDVTPALATLGIGGLALALAAQKTLENLFGGISVLSDRVMRVGDFVRIGELMGVVEDIGLRSTRIRTLDRTVLHLPNGFVAAQNLENFAMRDMFWFHPILNLRYETTPDQMRLVLSRLRELLYSHPKIRDGARARFIRLGGTSLDIEIFAYLEAIDHGESLAIAEDLLLRIMDVVAACGTGFAFPSQTLYFARDQGLDEEKSRKAAEQVSKWVEAGELPFPDYAQHQIAQLRKSIEYPPESSVLRKAAGREN